MKIKLIISFLMIMMLFACKKERTWENNNYETVELVIHDISKNFFNDSIPLQQLKTDYPFFFDDSADSVWNAQRQDAKEISIYQEGKKAIGDLTKLNAELTPLFSRFKHYFPNYQTPTVFVYSSGLQNIENPVLYSSRDKLMFITLDGFFGEKHSLYDSVKVYNYLRTTMNRDYLSGEIVKSIANDLVPFNPKNQSFLDLILYEGKKLILADALIPDQPDEFKIGYTPAQIEWSIQNEGNIWNFFVEQNYIFKADRTLAERFLQVGPFSKFNNEIEQDSPSRIGAWVGWQIAREYLKQNPEVKLEDFIHDFDSQKIFKESKYKPSKSSVTKYRTEKRDGVDELYHYAD